MNDKRALANEIAKNPKFDPTEVFRAAGSGNDTEIDRAVSGENGIRDPFAIPTIDDVKRVMGS